MNKSNSSLCRREKSYEEPQERKGEPGKHREKTRDFRQLMCSLLIKFNEYIVRVYYILSLVLGIEAWKMNMMWLQPLILHSLVLLKRYKV